MTLPSSHDYAGDLTAEEAWALLRADPQAQLVDVRTMAEWNFVGVPDLSACARKLHCIEWVSFPAMAGNPAFADEAAASVTAVGADEETPVLFICRSGTRSRAAAIALTAKGFRKAFNVAGGFEGDLDGGRHRGQVNGWKAAGLPWRQT